MSACKNCGGTEIDTSHGNAICTECGAVVSDHVIVSEVQFQENSAGISNVVGQFVSFEDGSRAYGRNSQQMTLHQGKCRIQGLASQLKMSSHCSEMAFKYFKLAVNKGITKGRKSNHVAAACLYIVCRTEKKPLMLLDFSDKLGIDVYTLGHTYRDLSMLLYIQIPPMEPCLFIERYAHQLEFGNKTSDVCKTATRLVSRMSRDWMVQGRRPSGICGAALLVAARIFNFNRSFQDIMKVVRIGERTIKKRLNEFEQTPSSQLTIEEFHTVNLEESMDPPSFTAGLKKAKLAELEEKGELPKLLEEAEQLKNELYKEIDELTRTNRKYRKFVGGGDALETGSLCSVAPSLDDLDVELAHYQHLLTEEKMEKLTSPVISRASTALLNNPDAGNNEISVSGSKSLREEDIDEDKIITDDLVNILNNDMSPTKDQIRNNPLPELALKGAIEECLQNTSEIETDGGGGQLDLDGIDDAELDEFICSNEAEVKYRTLAWMRANAEFLMEMKEKKDKKARELLENPPKKKRKPRKTKQKQEASSTREAFEKILQQSKLSDKINYDVITSFNVGKKKEEENSTDILHSECQVSKEALPSIPLQIVEQPAKKLKVDCDEVMKKLTEKEEVIAEELENDDGDDEYNDNDDQMEQLDYNALYEEQTTEENFKEYYESD